MSILYGLCYSFSLALFSPVRHDENGLLTCRNKSARSRDFRSRLQLRQALRFLINLQLAQVIHMSDSLESELIFACAAAFLASFAAHLWAISRNLGTSANLGTAMAAAGAAAIIQYFRGDVYSKA